MLVRVQKMSVHSCSCHASIDVTTTAARNFLRKYNSIYATWLNRKINVIQGNYIPIADLDLAEKQVRKVWLKEFGFVLVRGVN